MKVFDLHCHPTLKPLLSNRDDRPTPWDEINIWVDNPFGNIYDSQSTIDQLLDGGCNLACVGLMAIETAFVKRCIVKAIAGPVSYVDKKQVRRIGKALPGYTYEDLLAEEIDSIRKFDSNPEVPTEQVKFISSMAEYHPEDKHIMHLIASLEGGHGLYYDGNQYEDSNKLIDKIKAYRVNEPVRLLYLTLVHISQNALANHAFGIKILKKTHFFPDGNGITDLGHEIIKACLSEELPGKPILIDIKHLSLVARMDLYKKYAHKPIIASHIAVTGCSWKNKPIIKVRKRKIHDVYKVKYNRQAGHLPGTYFNPDSINLYDEDIVAILKSGGIMGLILDERVLGYPNNKTTSKEFVSKKEWDQFISANGQAIEDMTELEDLEDDQENEAIEMELDQQFAGAGKEMDYNLRRLHALYLLNNIIHIIKVGDKLEGIDPRKQIVLGSDFDGLINPIQGCTSADQFDDLIDDLKYLTDKYAQNEIPNCNEFIEDFFYRNGVAFLEKNF